MDHQKTNRKKTCFVIMPIGKKGTEEARIFKDIYDLIIKEAVLASRLSYDCKRVDEVQKPGTIIKDIEQMIKNADVVIADLTGRNPNVFYELGTRHALDKNTILMAQNLDEVPFDLQGERLIIYTPSEPRSVDETKKRIINFLKEIESIQSTCSPIPETGKQNQTDKKIPNLPSNSELVSLRHVIENMTYSLSENIQRFGEQVKDHIKQTVRSSLQANNPTQDSTPSLPILNTINACGISNIYERRNDAYDRIVSLIEEACERVDLMGISLRRFFHNESEISGKIKYLGNHPVKWRALVLDPRTEQALFRSLREQETTYHKLLDGQTFEYGNMNIVELFEVYDNIYKNMMLCTDVDKTRHDIHFTLRQAGLNIGLRYYKAAPACFLAFVDDFLFVEQYHYGSTLDERVAEQVPVFEFRRGSDMYKQMVGHFDHVWKRLSRSPDKSDL